jgi:hypothetical protein
VQLYFYPGLCFDQRLVRPSKGIVMTAGRNSSTAMQRPPSKVHSQAGDCDLNQSVGAWTALQHVSLQED